MRRAWWPWAAVSVAVSLPIFRWIWCRLAFTIFDGRSAPMRTTTAHTVLYSRIPAANTVFVLCMEQVDRWAPPPVRSSGPGPMTVRAATPKGKSARLRQAGACRGRSWAKRAVGLSMAPMLRLTHNRSALRTVLLFLCFADSFSDRQEQQPQFLVPAVPPWCSGCGSGCGFWCL